MAKRIFSTFNVTWATNTRGTQVATASSYMGLEPTTSATQIVDLDEVLISGTATASTIGAFLVTLFSTFATTPTALAAPNSDGPMIQGATPTIQTTFITAATQPTPSSSITAPAINLGINMFGGIVRWNAAPTQQYTMVGNAAPGGACLMNNATTGASGTANAHMIYEPY
jgi:hypothetical protein